MTQTKWQSLRTRKLFAILTWTVPNDEIVPLSTGSNRLKEFCFLTKRYITMLNVFTISSPIHLEHQLFISSGLRIKNLLSRQAEEKALESTSYLCLCKCFANIWINKQMTKQKRCGRAGDSWNRDLGPGRASWRGMGLRDAIDPYAKQTLARAPAREESR